MKKLDSVPTRMSILYTHSNVNRVIPLYRQNQQTFFSSLYAQAQRYMVCSRVHSRTKARHLCIIGSNSRIASIIVQVRLVYTHTHSRGRDRALNIKFLRGFSRARNRAATAQNKLSQRSTRDSHSLHLSDSRRFPFLLSACIYVYNTTWLYKAFCTASLSIYRALYDSVNLTPHSSLNCRIIFDISTVSRAAG